MLKRAVHCQLYSYLSKHKLLTPCQCGFRKKHSTDAAVISFTDFICWGTDQGMLTEAVFIDLYEAFDSVEHNILSKQLKSYGIDDIKLS